MRLTRVIYIFNREVQDGQLLLVKYYDTSKLLLNDQIFLINFLISPSTLSA